MTEHAGSQDADRWLTLGQASRLLGVHRSTLRRWADSGRVSYRRTAGGHRRFDRHAILMGREAASRPDPVGAQAEMDETVPTWRNHLRDPAQVAELREMGQRLSGIVIQFLGRSDADERLLGEAHRLGSDYATLSRRAGMSVAQAVEAFLFFRASLVRLLPPESEQPDESASRYERYEQIVSAVLVSLVRGYAEASDTSTESTH